MTMVTLMVVWSRVHRYESNGSIDFFVVDHNVFARVFVASYSHMLQCPTYPDFASMKTMMIYVHLYYAQ
jgi:hypothetical protein